MNTDNQEPNYLLKLGSANLREIQNISEKICEYEDKMLNIIKLFPLDFDAIRKMFLREGATRVFQYLLENGYDVVKNTASHSHQEDNHK